MSSMLYQAISVWGLEKTRRRGALAVKPKSPADRQTAAVLGPARPVWDALIGAFRAEYGALTAEWKPSKADFGRMCVLKQKKRTVVYLTPEAGAIRVAIVLGERAARRALSSELPDEIKTLIAEARPYAEGRGIRFPIRAVEEIPTVTTLVAIKMAT
jgi:hypothetical protein